MYNAYWNFSELPFENAPDVRFFYESRGHREGIARLLMAIETRKAITLLTGDYGSGKTLLCQTALSRLPPASYKVVSVTNPRMDAIDLIRELSFQLGDEINSRSKYDVLHAFQNAIQRHAASGRHVAMLVDEAQLIPDASVLEELRLLLNFHPQGHYLMTLILSGQTEVNERLRAIPQMVQRIGFRFHVPPLAVDEVQDYMRFRLEQAGGRIDIFEPGAVVEVARLSKGNPREINAIADLCLLAGYLKTQAVISANDVAEAMAERML